MNNVVDDGEAMNSPRYLENTTGTVQRNRIGTVPHVLIGCHNLKKEKSIRSIDKFVKYSINLRDLSKMSCRRKAMIRIIVLLTMGLVLIRVFDSYIPHKKQLAQFTNFPFNRTFNWDDLDLNKKKKAICGQLKSLFVDKVDPKFAYIVKAENILEADRYDATAQLMQQTKAFDQAQRLKVEYKIRHFLDGPPFIDKVPNSRTGYIMNEMINIVGLGKKVKIIPRYFRNSTVIVQRNRMGPIPHVLIGCYNDKKGIFSEY